MSKLSRQERGVLYIVTCAARSSEPMFVEDLVEQALLDEWNVGIIATPQARKFIDIVRLEQMTGYPVRSDYRHPEEVSDIFPEPDSIIVFPATFNTINKWALGIADTLALSVLCAHLGMGTPIVVIPCVPAFSLARHPAFSKNIALLQEYGVHLIYNPQEYPPMNNVPWGVMLQAVNNAVAGQREPLLRKEENVSR